MHVDTGLNSAPTEAEAGALELACRLERCFSDEHLCAPLRERARWIRATICLGIGPVERLVAVSEDAIRVLPQQPPLQAWDFSVRGTAPAWQELWQPVPKPGWHDIFALAKLGEMRIDGSLLPFMANLQFFKDLVALPRGGRS